MERRCSSWKWKIQVHSFVFPFSFPFLDVFVFSHGSKKRYATKASYEGAFVKGKRHGQGDRAENFVCNY